LDFVAVNEEAIRLFGKVNGELIAQALPKVVECFNKQIDELNFRLRKENIHSATYCSLSSIEGANEYIYSVIKKYFNSRTIYVESFRNYIDVVDNCYIYQRLQSRTDEELLNNFKNTLKAHINWVKYILNDRAKFRDYKEIGCSIELSFDKVMHPVRDLDSRIANYVILLRQLNYLQIKQALDCEACTLSVHTEASAVYLKITFNRNPEDEDFNNLMQRLLHLRDHLDSTVQTSLIKPLRDVLAQPQQPPAKVPLYKRLLNWLCG